MTPEQRREEFIIDLLAVAVIIFVCYVAYLIWG